MSNNIKHDAPAMLAQAYTLISKAGEVTTSAQQLAAAAIMFRHEEQASQGVPMPALAKLVKGPNGSKEARKSYMDTLCGVIGLPERDKGKNETAIRANRDRGARYAVIDRGLTLAASLAQAGVTSASWVDGPTANKPGLFHVPASALKLAGDVASGGLAKDDNRVPLDGRAFMVMRGDAVETILATAKQVVAIAEAKAGVTKAASTPHKRAEDASAKPVPVSDLFKLANARLNECGLQMLYTEANRLIMAAQEIHEEGRDMPDMEPWDALPEAERRALEGLEIYIQERRAVVAKPDA